MTNDPEAIAEGGLKTLKKAQEILGSLHDHEVLKERFTRLADRDKDGSSVEAVLAAIEAECDRLFAAYVTRRAALLDVCVAVERFAASPGRRVVRPASLLRIASVALPLAALLAARAGVPRLPGPTEMRLER